MTIQTINLGNYANDGTGDDLRVAFTKVNANFAALDASAAIANGVNVGTGIGIFFAKDTTNLQFKSLTSTNNSVTISSTGNTVDLAAVTRLQSDSAPTLGANLNLNNKYVYGGDIQSTVYGYNVPITTNFNSLLVESNNLNVDMGSFLFPTGYQTDGLAGKKGYLLDWGLFSDTPVNDKLNFGTFSDHLTGGIGQLTLAGNLTTTGAYNLTLATTGNTSLTLPTSGTLTTTTNNLSAFASTTSAQLASIISDKTGTGALVFATNPVLVAPTIGVATATSLTFADTSVQTTAWPGSLSAGSLTGTTLNSTVVTSSLTSVGSLTALTVAGTLTISASNKVMIGSQANTTRFPSAQVVISTVSAGIQQNEAGQIGIIGEVVGASANRNAGVYGVGYTSGSFSAQGVVGEAHVSATGDTAPAVGVRGYANDAHTGGNNVGLYGDATNGLSNYSLYLVGGDIYTSTAKTWYLNGNLTFNGASYTVGVTNFSRSGLEIAVPNYITVSSTATYVLSITNTDNILLVTAGALTATLTFPSSGLVDGQRLRFTVTTNTVTLALTAGPTLVGTFAGSVTAPTTFTYVYRTSNTTWYRI